MNGSRGFTLLEVVVAAGLLAFGAMALLTLQAQALQVQRRVRIVRELVNSAEGELELRRVSSGVSGECRSPASSAPIIDSCRVEIEQCVDAIPSCGGPSADRAVRVTVSLTAASGVQHFALTAITARFPPP